MPPKKKKSDAFTKHPVTWLSPSYKAWKWAEGAYEAYKGAETEEERQANTDAFLAALPADHELHRLTGRKNHSRHVVHHKRE